MSMNMDMNNREQPILLGHRSVQYEELRSCSLGENETFTIHMKNGESFRLTKGEPGHDWVHTKYRNAWKKTTSCGT
jgi:hypothetical protein